MRLRHPDPAVADIEIPDDNNVATVLGKSGWERLPEPTQANPALAPGEPETKPTKATAKKATEAD